MYRIRNGVFETNSSSVHVISIQKDPPKDIFPLHISRKYYGWKDEFLDTANEKASYFYTALACLKNELHEPTDNERKGMINLLPEDIRYDCKFEDDECYIDHCDELLPWVQDLVDDNEKFLRFIFGDDSYVHTGNDNIDYEDYEYPDKGIHDDGSEVFIKGN